MKTKCAIVAATAALVLAGCTGADDHAGSTSSATSAPPSTGAVQSKTSTRSATARTSATPKTSRPSASTTTAPRHASPTQTRLSTKTKTCSTPQSGRTYPCTPEEYRRLADDPSMDEQDSPRPGDKVQDGNVTKRVCLDPIEGTTSYCTESEYQDLQRWNRRHAQGPTQEQCTNKNQPATWDSCSARGFSWGMTTDQMRQRDKNATCATGTQLYWVENNCRLLPDGETYSDGSKLE